MVYDVPMITQLGSSRGKDFVAHLILLQQKVKTQKNDFSFSCQITPEKGVIKEDTNVKESLK